MRTEHREKPDNGDELRRPSPDRARIHPANGACAPSCLPLSLPPRCLSRAQAAAYAGIGVTMWDELVASSTMPPPLRGFGRRNVWDRYQIDTAITALTDDGGNGAAANPFDELLKT